MSETQFWSTLLGAAAAFTVGMTATWLAGLRAKRTAGNLALITVSQMFQQLGDLRDHFVFKEPARVKSLTGQDPVSWMIWPYLPMPTELPKIAVSEIGFLVDSHDPDVLNRLLIAERAFRHSIELVRRHLEIHTRFVAKFDFGDSSPVLLDRDTLLKHAGLKILVELDDAVEGVRKALQETTEGIYTVLEQLGQVLRLQFPLSGFLNLKRHQRSPVFSDANNARAAEWRYAARSAYGKWRRVRRWVGWRRSEVTPPSAATQEPAEIPIVLRFYPRSP